MENAKKETRMRVAGKLAKIAGELREILESEELEGVSSLYVSKDWFNITVDGLDMEVRKYGDNPVKVVVSSELESD